MNIERLELHRLQADQRLRSAVKRKIAHLRTEPGGDMVESAIFALEASLLLGSDRQGSALMAAAV